MIVDQNKSFTHLDLHLRTNRLGNYLPGRESGAVTGSRFPAAAGPSTSRCCSADAAVIGFKSPEWGEAVKAFVVPNQKAHCDGESLIRFCKESLAS